MKLWKTETESINNIDRFTVGKDREMDLLLAKHDVIGSMAHAEMLCKCGLLTNEENAKLQNALNDILSMILNNIFIIEEGIEDVHSQIEKILTDKCGETGKKIHTARSRNDQSLTDIKLFIREELKSITGQVEQLFDTLIQLSEKHIDKLMPGYTHYQLAMPSSFGLWFSAYAESLSEDLEVIKMAYGIADKNPLGSAAGYGSSFPVDREYTTALLGFSDLNINAVYAQMTRGKTEKQCAWALSAVAATLSKMAGDIVLFMNQEFGYISFPDKYTTGSSIMPHKKNPDVWELVRGKCARLQSLPNELTLLINNLPSGYHREFQLTKEILFPAIKELKEVLSVTTEVIAAAEIKADILKDSKYDTLFTVEAVNELVMQGFPFREAYHIVSKQVMNHSFSRPNTIKHTHTGSIGNTGNKLITERFKAKMKFIK
ncbi:MAG: argininosuccinate lyase [Bacteroidia bacterium]